MSKKQLIDPLTQTQGDSTIVKTKTNFGIMFKDVPASELQPGNLELVKNGFSLGNEIQGRRGSVLHSDTAIPSVTDRTGMTCSKALTTVTKTAGPDFEAGDILGNYVVWADGTNDEITSYTDATHVEVRRSGTQASEADVYIRAARFGNGWHRSSSKVLNHIGTKLYSCNYNFDTYTEIYPISYETLGRSKSLFYNWRDDFAILFNGTGVFAVNMAAETPYYWRINSPVPETQITDVDETDILTVGRRYIYSNSALRGGLYHGNRIGDPTNDNVSTLTVEQETGTTLINEKGTDYGEVFTEKEIGVGNDSYGLIIGGIGSIGHATGVNKDIDDWRTLTGAGARLNINGLGPQDLFFDFTTVGSLNEVCTVIEDQLKVYVSSATCEIKVNAANIAVFHLTTGKISGGSFTAVGGALEPVTSPTDAGLTDISGYDAGSGCGLLCDDTEGGVIALSTSLPTSVNTYYTEENTIGDLVSGYVTKGDSALIQRDKTHFSVYGTLDIGPAGTDRNTGITNKPEVYAWIEDVPIMKAFLASEGVANLITAPIGLFTQADIGCTLTFEDTTQTVIQYLTDAAGNRTYNATSQYAEGNLGATALQSCVLGSATCLTCTQVGTTVTRASGTRAFTANDIQKPIYWAEGEISYITAYTDGDNVTVMDFNTRASQGVAIDPTSRKYTDTLRDVILKSRFGENFYLAGHRFFTPLPNNCNIGAVAPGFIVAAVKNDMTLYYSQVANGLEFRAGYYDSSLQKDSNAIEDAIQSVEYDIDGITIRCYGKTYESDPSAAYTELLKEYGITRTVLQPFKFTDDIGCVNTRSIQRVGIGKKIMITSEPEVRYYENGRYSPSLSARQLDTVLRKASTFSHSEYNPITGYLFYLASEEI